MSANPIPDEWAMDPDRMNKVIDEAVAEAERQHIHGKNITPFLLARRAVEEAAVKKKLDLSKVEFLALEEGLCVQCMHNGPYDDEPATVKLMDEYLGENGYENDFSDERLHHEIYLSDA